MVIPMNEILRSVLIFLLSKRYIGGKHMPEEKLILRKTRWIGPQMKMDFYDGYDRLVKDGLILRSRKRTGKGMGWHIALNPRRLMQIHEIIYGGEPDGINRRIL